MGKRLILYVLLAFVIIFAGASFYCVGPLLTTKDGARFLGELILHPNEMRNLLKVRPNVCTTFRLLADYKTEWDKGEEGKFGEAIIARADGIRIHDLRNMATVLQLYREKNGSYPASNGVEEINKQDFATSNLAGHLSGVAEVSYILYGPYDWDRSVVYWYESDGISYELFTALQNPQGYEGYKCVQEGSVCIYRIRNGEAVNEKSP